MEKIQIECNIGEVSDGYHTFNELYEHRVSLFIALMKSHFNLSWISLLHNDGSFLEGWFVAGMHLPSGDITYHLPMWRWDYLKSIGILVLENAPEWDGHTSNNVIHRLDNFDPKLKL